MKLSFRNLMLLSIFMSCIICTGSAIFVSSQKLKAEGIKSLIDKSKAILSRLEVGTNYVADMGTLDTVIKETVQHYSSGNIPQEQKLKILKSVPIFAAFQIGQIGAEKENYIFRVAAEKPRKKEYQATLEEQKIIDFFKNNPQQKEHVEISANNEFIRLTKPIYLSEKNQCLKCHGHPSTSPWGNGQDILGYPMENMKDGDLKGTYSIISSLQPIQRAVYTSTIHIACWGFLITIIAVGLIYFIIKNPLKLLTTIAANLLATANKVTSMSQYMATSSDQLSEGAKQQASSLGQTATAIEEINNTVSKNAENAEQSKLIAGQGQSKAEQGKKTVIEMIDSIKKIDEGHHQFTSQIEKNNQEITSIVNVINEIGEKTKIINDIVFQTKLLSFNASVEAARAGEHGRGFAVVAEEIGNLAQMSGKAAQEISGMLEKSTNKVEKIVEDSKSNVAELAQEGQENLIKGTEVAKRCEEVLEEIVLRTSKIGEIISEIATSSSEQSKGVNEINHSMHDLDQITQKNVKASTQSLKAAEELSEQANDLRASVELLMNTLEGQKKKK